MRRRFANRLSVLSWLWVATVLVPAGGAHATLWAPISDEALAAQSPVILDARVVDAGLSPKSGFPARDYIVRVERVLKGVAPSQVVVRVPGGVASDGSHRHIAGAPRFRVGQETLLFLHPEDDGTYSISQFMLGVFHKVKVGDSTLAVRRLEEAALVLPPGGEAPGDSASQEMRGELARDADRFTAWLTARARGQVLPADYFVRPSKTEELRITEEFTLFEGGGYNYRWFDFDDGASTTWYASTPGLSEMTGGGYAEVQAALAAWTDDPESDIRLEYGGTTQASNGFLTNDGINTVLFDDPNDEIGGSFDCSSGGVLAIGGINGVDGLRSLDGQQFWQVTEGDVITQDGAGCYFAFFSGALGEQVFAHEVGHAMGFGHSCGDASSPSCGSSAVLNDALMRAYAHFDDRGARLGSDDRAAATFLYPETAVRRDDLVGLGLTSNKVYYSDDLASWQSIPGGLLQVVTGDFDNDGRDELAGLGNSSLAYVSLDLQNWTSLGRTFSLLSVGDLNGDGWDDLAGLDASGSIWITLDLETWDPVPGRLELLVTGDFNDDGMDDLAGLSEAGRIWYSLNLTSWTQIPGSLASLEVGDWDGDGREELAGVSAAGRIYYSSDMVHWQQIAGTLGQLVAGDWDGDGLDELAGISPSSRMYYTTDMDSWIPLGGQFNSLTRGNFDADPSDELAVTDAADAVFYTDDLSSWMAIPGNLRNLVSGDLDLP